MFSRGMGVAIRCRMANAFDKWTVLPHEPVQKHSENLWSVQGTMPDGKTRRQMTVAKMSDGRLMIHNAIALEDALMSELEAFGKPSFLVVPSGYHRMDARVFKERYPSLTVLCPSGHRKRVEQVIKVDGSYDDAPKDDAVSLRHLDGLKGNEGVLQVTSPEGTSLVFNDAINNLPQMGGFFGFLFAPTGRPSVPRLARWIMVKDKPAFRAQLDALADTSKLQRIIVSHGEIIASDPAKALHAVASELVS
jgi:hypothetical protein